MFSGHSFVALLDGELKGFLHFTASPQCLPPAEQMPALTERLFEPLGDSVPRLVDWFSTWSRLDPEARHLHLGPIAVAPTAQGQGIGTALMDRFIDHLVRQRSAGYLKTDRPENVDFYKKFGFSVKREVQLIGIPTWYMWRGAKDR